jgi:VWFA-related protein
VSSRIRHFALIVLLIPLPFLASQNKKDEKGQDSKFTFRLPVNVVVVHTTVSDKQGNPVPDLKQSDFRIYEDGKLQDTQTFAMESYEPVPSSGSPADAIRAKGDSDRPAMAAPNASRSRMISLVVDDATISSVEYYPVVLRAMTRFVEQDMRDGDQVAILAGSGRVQFPFSDNKQILLEEINGLSKKLSVSQNTKSDCPPLSDYQAKQIAEGRGGEGPAALADLSQIDNYDLKIAVEDTLICADLIHLMADETRAALLAQARRIAIGAASRQYQETEYRTSMLLHTLRQHLRMLRHFDAVKSVILFSNGFLAEGESYISYELQDVVDHALAAGVVLNTIDIRGLYTAIVPASESNVSYFPEEVNYRQNLFLDNMRAQETPLSRLANDTGGLFYHNNNDIHAGIRNSVHRDAFYYVLTYASPQQKPDGRFHRIKVEVSRSGLELNYRKGYYAPREELSFERRKKEDILEAMQAPDNLNEIPIDLAYNYYQEDDTHYEVSLSTNVSVRKMRFLDEDSRRKNLINLVVVAFEKSIDFKLTDASYASLLQHGITSNVAFSLPTGRYKIKAVVREGAQGKMGSITKTIEIP